MKSLNEIKKEIFEAEQALDYSKIEKLTVTNSDGQKEIHTAKSDKTVEDAESEESEESEENIKKKIKKEKKED